MKRAGVGLAVCALLGPAVARLAQAVPRPTAKTTIVFVDLQPKSNGTLAGDLHSSAEGNNLAEVPRGVQMLGGVKFKIGDGLIQLANNNMPKMPDKVSGIKVDRAFASLHILHATGFGNMTPADTVIGTYTINYQDKTTATIDIVYGKDVRDWWYNDSSPGVTRGRVVWKGNNAHAKKLGAKIRLYLMTWKNPHPGKRVMSIDYASTKSTHAAPFCVAMTAEGE
jgi:hypothetical protein